MTTNSCVSLGFAGLAAASLAFAASPADATGQLSLVRVDAVVGSPTNAIRASDLNADGQLDLVVSGGQRVFVLTGRGDGRFDPSWSGAAGENPSDLAIVAHSIRASVTLSMSPRLCGWSSSRDNSPAVASPNAWPQGSWRSG